MNKKEEKELERLQEKKMREEAVEFLRQGCPIDDPTLYTPEEYEEVKRIRNSMEWERGLLDEGKECLKKIKEGAEYAVWLDVKANEKEVTIDLEDKEGVFRAYLGKTEASMIEIAVRVEKILEECKVPKEVEETREKDRRLEMWL